MKKLLFFVLVSASLCAQNKLQLKNIDIGGGGFSVLLKNSGAQNESGGLTFNTNAEFALNKHLFSVNFLLGGGGGSGYISIGGDFTFYKIDLLYGRQFNLYRWLAFDAQTGLGYYHQNSHLYFSDFESNQAVINIPIKASLIFLSNRTIGFGFNANYDMNKLNNTFSGNFILRYNFLK